MAKRRGASRYAAARPQPGLVLAGVWSRLAAGPLRLLAWLALSATLLYGATWMSDPWSFPIDTVTLEGELQHTDVARLREAVTPYAAAGFFGVDVGAVRRAALHSPWVADASVIRRWPSTLVVKVVERQAAARWGAGALLDTDGEAFYPEQVDERLPQLSGPPGSATQVYAFYREIETGAMGRLPPLQSVELDRRGVLRLGYARGPQVTLRAQSALDQWQRFLHLWSVLDDERRGTMQSADLRYTAGMAVRWHVTGTDDLPAQREQAG